MKNRPINSILTMIVCFGLFAIAMSFIPPKYGVSGSFVIKKPTIEYDYLLGISNKYDTLIHEKDSATNAKISQLKYRLKSSGWK